jgi:hypothetical protein
MLAELLEIKILLGRASSVQLIGLIIRHLEILMIDELNKLYT